MAPGGKLRADLAPALLLGAMGAATIPLLFPYILAIIPSLAGKLAAARVPLWIAVAGQTLQAFLIFALMSWAGLSLGKALGLDAPWMRAAVDAKARRVRQHPAWLLAIALGLACGALVWGLDFALKPHFPAAVHLPSSSVTKWKGFLGSFYGGIGEEIVARLFVMTLVAWIAVRFLRGPKPSAYWCASVLAALLFGTMHLPTTLRIWPLSPIVVVHALLLNGIAGTAFGWLFWKRGLEHAMVAHFSSDLVAHVVAG